MVYQRVHRSSSWNSPSLEKSSLLAPHPLAVHAQQDSHLFPAQEQRASRFDRSFAHVPAHSPHQPGAAPIQYRLAVQPDGATVPGLGDRPAPSVEHPPNRTGLPNQLKAGIENISGYSLDAVRVHYNSSKPAQLQAFAYTQGAEIHVAPGQEKHLPHEAWHVVQQMQGRVKPTMQMKGVQINDNEGLEQEADLMGAKIQGQQADSGVRVDRHRSVTPTSSIAQRARVVRGGTCLADQFVSGAERIGEDGKLYGVSTSSNLALEGDVNVLGNTVFNNKIGVSTTEAITAAGGKCVSTPTRNNPWHTDLNGLTGEEAAAVFQVIKNPNPKKR